MKNPITFITGNEGKAKQLSQYLGVNVSNQKVDLTEIQSLSLAEIISEKAKEAYKIVGSPVVVDDVSLVIHALGNLPGPFIKFFIEEMGNEGICKLVSGFENRLAKAEVCIGYYDGENLEICMGEIEGEISLVPKGSNGFGWDEIFIPKGYIQTRSEMSEKDYDATNPRKFALEKLKQYLEIL